MRDSTQKDEALDRTQMVSFIVAEHLTSHPFVCGHTNLAAICARISHDLADLYRAIDETGNADPHD